MTRVEHIGQATLFLGDSREIAQSVGAFDAVITDPPYKFEKSARRSEARGAAEKNGTFKRLFGAGLHNGFNIADLETCENVIVFCAKNQLPEILRHTWAVDDQRWMLICWHKTKHQYLTGSYAPDTEYIVHRWGAGGLAKTGLPRFFVGNSEQITTHPTEKPVWLMERLIMATSGVVLDPYMGSGTTGVACAKLARPFIGVERVPEFFDMACRRIEQASRQQSLFAAE